MKKTRLTFKDLNFPLSGIHLTNEWKRHVNSEVENLMAALSQDLIKRFLKHPVTKEISEGPEGANISGTLGGYSNLFGFIGFYEGDDPIGPIVAMLKKYRIKVLSSRGKTKVKITVPTLPQIWAVSHLPWAKGRSWVRGVEKGISGLGQYLQTDNAKSRSGEGLQIKKTIRKASFTPVDDYLSVMMADYRKQIRKLKRQYK